MKSYSVDGARIGQARQAVLTAEGKPLKQVEAAEILGVHAVTLNRIENGKAKVSLDLLERLVVLTGRSREWLLGEPEAVDALELSRERVASALAKIAEGFEELALDEVLNRRLRDQIGVDVAEVVVP